MSTEKKSPYAEMEPSEKVKILERVVKWITGADELRWKKFSGRENFGWLTLVNLSPRVWKTEGMDEGLHMEWNSEIYDDEYLRIYCAENPDVVEPEFSQARILGEIWFQEDIYEINKNLREEIKKLKTQLASQLFIP